MTTTRPPAHTPQTSAGRPITGNPEPGNAPSVASGTGSGTGSGKVPRSIARQIFDALANAATGTGLTVTGTPDLEGASVRGPHVEAYIYASSGGALAIDLWRHTDNDPYAILRSNDLHEAVHYAIIHAAGHHPTRHALPPHTPPTIWFAPLPEPPARHAPTDPPHSGAPTPSPADPRAPQ